jgi:hypothetical protein
MRVTNRQHYVAACYLAGFTEGGTRDSLFYVHSLDGHTRQDKPGNVAMERDYNSVYVDGLRKDHLESFFQKFEGPACTLFRTLSLERRPFLTEEEFSVAVEFLAIQAARVPLSKQKYGNLIIENGQEFFRQMAYSPAFFQAVADEAKLDESERRVGATLREAFESGGVKRFADQSGLAASIFRLALAIIEQIVGANMGATLWYTDGPDWFVCADHPVALFYSISGDMFEDPGALENPTVRLLTDSIYMPLARNVALVMHQLSGVPPAQLVPQAMVAVVNAMTLIQAQRNVFSCTKDFVCRLPGGTLGNAQESIKAVLSFRAATGSSDPASTLS